jgi:hypothetical protein
VIYHFLRLGFTVATADHKQFEVFQRHYSSREQPRYAHRLNPHATTSNLEEANLVCRVDMSGRPQVAFNTDAKTSVDWLARIGELLEEVEHIAKCPLPSGDVVDTRQARFGHCRDCSKWRMGPDMKGPSSMIAGGTRIVYGMCGSRRNGLGGRSTELSDDGEPMPMVHTETQRAPHHEAPDAPWCGSPSAMSLNTREDFGCPDFEPKGT